MRTVLESNRLRLREMTMDDLDFVAEMIAHPEVMRYYPKLYSRAEAEEWVNRQMGRYRSHGYGLWLVSDKATSEPVGQVGLTPQIVDGIEEPEIGYLIHRPYWRQGLASEAAIAVRDYAFESLGKDHVISLIRPVNEPSQGVARKFGMQPGRKTIYAGLEHIVFLLTKDEWERQTCSY
jgi:[ribosomal protein S5]-alanine N-acetyltransferase